MLFTVDRSLWLVNPSSSPTNFFDRMADLVDDDEEGDEDEGITADATRGTESVQMSSPTLSWPAPELAYKYHHHSLIAFSNRHFYERTTVVVFPSPYVSNVNLGLLHYHYVEAGAYAARQNLPEAIRVVDAVISHMMTDPDLWLGVVSLAITQRGLIEMLFEKKSRNFPQVQEYLSKWERKEGHREPFFIENLENVQGDERDLITSRQPSVRDGTGPVAQNFGPISKQGGWRRLNVLFTRANTP